ncbi:MAG: redoxin domain-containing protein [Acidobacteriota bacterium]|nr:redoxin domain-containing protein [Acidobacteriota bacterium]
MEGANIYTALISFLGGLASFLSPCVLPLVPGYISLISGVSIDHLKGGDGASRQSSAKRAVIMNSLAFNAGLSLIFLALGAAAGWAGAAILSDWRLRVVGGLVIIAFGLQLIGVLKIAALYRDTRKFSDDKPRGPLGSFTLGMAFAAGWTPCIGPILGGIIGLAATSGGWKSGLVLSAFYSAGLSLPFLLTGLGINRFLNFYAGFRRHLHKVEVVSGVLLIVIGIMVASNSVTWLANFAAKSGLNLEAVVDSFAKRHQPTAPASSAQSVTTNAAAYPPLPDAELKTLDGNAYRLSDLRGRVVLLNFWATWCLPCRNEIPEFNEMQRDYEAKGFTVVGITSHDTVEDVRSFQQDVKQDYTVLLGTDDIPEKFQNGPGLPVTYIIDREGRVRHKIIGARDRAGFEAAVKPVLDELPATAAAQPPGEE